MLPGLLAIVAFAAEPDAPPPKLSSPPSVRYSGGVAVLGLPEGHPAWAPVFQSPTTASVGPFWLDRYEVLATDYGTCMETGPCSAPTVQGDGCNPSSATGHPINCVTALQADAYCGWRGARLPTETEWEFAARGPEGRLYPWGESAPADDQYHRLPGDRTLPVGSLPAAQSPEGVHDLSGNVWEWTSSGSDSVRVAKGGASMPSVGANRFLHPEDARFWYLGFRCAGEAPRSAVDPQAPGAATPDPRVVPRSGVADPPAPSVSRHWSELSPRSGPDVIGVRSAAVTERVICWFDVGIDTTGTIREVAVNDCPTSLAEAAAAALRKATYWPLERVIQAKVPVFVDPE